jgi:hypothetical protein
MGLKSYFIMVIKNSKDMLEFNNIQNLITLRAKLNLNLYLNKIATIRSNSIITLWEETKGQW